MTIMRITNQIEGTETIEVIADEEIKITDAIPMTPAGAKNKYKFMFPCTNKVYAAAEFFIKDADFDITFTGHKDESFSIIIKEKGEDTVGMHIPFDATIVEIQVSLLKLFLITAQKRLQNMDTETDLSTRITRKGYEFRKKSNLKPEILYIGNSQYLELKKLWAEVCETRLISLEGQVEQVFELTIVRVQLDDYLTVGVP